MACERNRILDLKEYLSSLGISINIGTNKARGHKGLFMHSFNNYRIDVSKGVPNDGILSVILHEFAHFIHYSYDNTLKSLDFIFDDFTDEIREELIKITVQEVPKEYAAALYSKKNNLNTDIKNMAERIKVYYPDFKLSEKYKKIEHEIGFPFKYLLKYDRVKIAGNLYTIEDVENYGLKEDVVLYLEIKSKQRAVKRINSRISKLNRYYNSPTELFARFLDSYYTKKEYTEQIAPIAYSKMVQSDNPYIEKLNYIFS